MKKWHILIGLSCLATVYVSCGKSMSKTLDDCPVVGSIVQVGEDKVVSCDQKLLRDTIVVPLSMLAEELEIVRLDNREEALVGQAGVKVTDNYILVQNEKQRPFKLFDRKGNFLNTIGSYGQGPSEYQNVYDFQLDEKNNRIYILPWQSSNLLVYDLQGNAFPSIPLCLRVPKGKFVVDAADSTIAVILLPFQGLPAVAWTQDFQGNRKSYIEPGHLTVPQDYSNEVISGHNTPEFDVNILSIMPTRVDSLYHYDYKNNRLRPCFTLQFVQDPIPWHGYAELPWHFVGDASLPVEVAPGMFESSAPTHYIIDKQTVKGSYCRFINDYLGDVDMWPAFSNGYYLSNLDPGNLRDMLENSQKSGKLTEEAKKKQLDILSSIKENDNNYVMIARLKK